MSADANTERKPTPADYAARRKTHGNQFTSLGGDNRRKVEARDRIRTGAILNRLHRAAEGKLEMSQTQVQACKILIDKTMPSLQSVEQTTGEQEINPGQVIERLQAMLASPHILRALAADPTTRAQLQSALNAAPVAVHTPTDTPDSPSAAAA